MLYIIEYKMSHHVISMYPVGRALLSRMGTSETTRHSSILPQMRSLSCWVRLASTGYFTSSGKGFSGIAVSKGSPFRSPNLQSL